MSKLEKEIKKAMVEHDLNIKQLSAAIRRPSTTVSYWIHNPESMSMENWRLLNSVLHLPAAVFARAGGFVIN